MNFLETMKGPEFLALYLGWFVFVFCCVLVARKCGADSPITTSIGLILFEGLGVARLIIGSAHGMHKFEILFVMMFVGAILFLVRAENLSSGSGSSSGGSCGGGGCGGGGCGGGGCGGCGG